MGQRSSVALSAGRRADQIRTDLGRELARMREDAGLSRAAVARAARVNGTTVGRIEAAAIEPDLAVLVRIAAVLGSEISIRVFPSGAPIRDRFQAPMLEALLDLADQTWQRHPEVPVTGVIRRVIDCVLAHPTCPLLVATEVQSEIRRADGLLRRSADTAEALSATPLARARADRLNAPTVEVSRRLVVRSTASTRAVIRDLSNTFAAAFPARTADALEALRDPARPWPGSAIVWVNLHGRSASIMDGPPRGVTVGR